MKKHALITGASGGIGFELAKIAAEEKYNLIITARSKDKLEEIARSLSNKHHIEVLHYPLDLSKPESVKDLYEAIKKDDIIPDILINNAGFGNYGEFTESNWEKEYTMLSLNIVSLTYLTKLFINEMVKKGSGMIMNVASTAAFNPLPYMAVYGASKAYVLSLSEALQAELKGKGISVTTLCPGPTKTGFEKNAAFENSKLFSRLPVATPDKVARIGFKGMKKGKSLVIPGWFNKVNYLSAKFSPRVMLKNITVKLMK